MEPKLNPAALVPGGIWNPGEVLWGMSLAEAGSHPILSLARRAAPRGEEPGLPADCGAAGRLQDHAVRRERGRRRVSDFSIPLIPAWKQPGLLESPVPLPPHPTLG